jgi:hypothetical protein
LPKSKRHPASHSLRLLPCEDGDWKLVQAHTSVGVPNDQLVGQTLPT